MAALLLAAEGRAALQSHPRMTNPAKVVRSFALLCLCGLFPCSVFSQSNNLAEASRRAGQLMAAGKYEEAAPIYRQLARAIPHNPGLSLDLGLALHMSGHEQEAIREFNKTLQLDPHNLPARLYLGYAYLSLGDPGHALEPLEQVVRADPTNIDASESLANALLSLGRFDEAAARFRAMVKVEPASAAAWYGLGRSYQSLSQHSYEELGKIAYGSAYWLALVAEANTKAGKYSSAFYLYHQALAKMPGLPGIHAGLATIYAQTGHADWAKTEKARERAAPPPDCARRATECAFLAGHYDQVIAVAGKSPETLYWKSKAFDQLALRALLRLGDFPSSPQLHELLAETHEKARDYPVAIQEWRKAYQLSHQDPQIGKRLAVDLLQTHDNQGAEQLLKTILGEQPNSAEVNYLMGYALLNRQKPAGAIPYLAKSLRLDPTMLKAHGELGRAYLQAGQSAKAIPQLKAALSLDADGSLHYQLARAYAATGQTALAQPMLKAYQQLHQADEKQAQELKQTVRVTPP
ncbi:MAG: tetratricopeptide repeat protein [Terriglobia bacterium]